MFEGDKWTACTKVDELVGKSVYWIEEDTKGNIWFITPNEISKYTPDVNLIQGNL